MTEQAQALSASLGLPPLLSYLSRAESVRFADVNTPEVGEVGYEEAKDYVISLVEGKTVYLDIDDISRTDPYDRLVCVVYFDYNSTHYENLNKALLAANLAVDWDHNNNEFSPNSWDLYVPKTAIPELPLVAVLLLIIVPVSLVLVKGKKRSSEHRKPDVVYLQHPRISDRCQSAFRETSARSV